LDWMTHRGPFQPLPFCDSVIQIPACALNRFRIISARVHSKKLTETS